MKRAVLLIVVCLCGGLWSRVADAATVGFDAATAGAVWSAALTYIAPRSLEPLTIPQMTIWGLNGLAALDPDLNTTLQDGQVRLYGPNALLLALPAPTDNDAAGWGKTASQIAAAAYAASPALQQAGTQAIVSSFFDELFNHFDPYSRYETPTVAAQNQLVIMGLAGTGLTLAAKSGRVVISAVAADSPAENAGLIPGMVVLSMDGRAAYPGALDTLNANMSGLAGSTTTLSLQDTSDDPPTEEQVTLTRGFIPPQTVFPEASPGPGLVALKITAFNKGTADQFTTALAALMAQRPAPTGLVLDLRGNRGGVLRQAVLVADLLLPTGMIVQTMGRDPDADQSFKAEGADLTLGAKLAVLVDGQTASAAEILAAALADNGRAVVIGSETLGKGLVQTLTSLPDGGELYVTWSRVLAPRGWPMQSLGVMPQVCTSLGPQMLETELASLDKGSNLQAQAVAAARTMRAPVAMDSVLQIRNQCPADIGTDMDFTAASRILASQAAYQAALLH